MWRRHRRRRLHFALAIADEGYAPALMADPSLRDGLNIHDGHVTHKAVAETLGLPYVPASALKG